MNDVRLAAIELYLQSGRPCSVAEIAFHAGVSEGVVRRLIAKNHGSLGDGMATRQGAVTTYSRNYPSMEHGAKKVWLHGPGAELLRGALIANAVCDGCRWLARGAS